MEAEGGRLTAIGNDRKTVYLYDWLDTLMRYGMSGVYHQFILYFNINDYYLIDRANYAKSLEDYL